MEDDSSKFNMEKAFQKKLHEILSRASDFATILDNPVGRFKHLKQAKLMVLERMLPEEEEIDTKLQLNANRQYSDYSSESQKRRINKEILADRRARFEISLDEWEIHLRKIMVRLKMFLLSGGKKGGSLNV